MKKNGFISRYKRLLFGQAFGSQERDPAERACILGLLLRGVLGMLLIVNIYVLAHFKPAHLPLLAFYNGITCGVIILFMRRKLWLTSVSLILALFSIAILLSIQKNVPLSLPFLVYAVIMLISGLLFDVQSSKSIGLVTILGTFSLFFIHQNGFAEILSYVVLLSIIGIISWIFNEQISRHTNKNTMYEEKFIEHNHLSRIGKMATGLIHDLANPVTYVETLLRLKSSHNKQKVLNGIRQIALLIESTRKQIQHSIEYRTFSPSEEVFQALEFLRYELERKKLFYKANVDRHITLYGDPSIFHQCVVNLLSNAIEAYDDTIPIQRRQVLIALRHKHNTVILTVTDHAHGISCEHRGKIFTPFFTTKPASVGTGIGLVSTKEHVEHVFHGVISFSTEDEKGTTFSVRIPAPQ